MTTKPKSNSVITTKVEGGVITFQVKDAGELLLDTSRVSESNRSRAMLHGFVQRVSDRAAISRNTETGLPATPSEKLAAMKELVEFYETGTEQWAMTRSGGGGVQLDTQLLVKALGEIYPERTEEQLSAWVRKRSSAERVALLMSEKVKPIVERLREGLGKGVDSEGLLAELAEPTEEE